MLKRVDLNPDYVLIDTSLGQYVRIRLILSQVLTVGVG